MPTKKPAGKGGTKQASKGASKRKGGTKKRATARVQMDAETVHRFESALRDGLVGSSAVMMTDNKTPKLKRSASVELDAPTAARISEALRAGLVSSGAVMATENEGLDKMTKKVKKRASSKSSKSSK
jgi:hypothetical protein